MSTAAAAIDAGEASPKKKGKKKLIVILAAVLLLAGVGGGAAVYIMKKKAAEAAAAAEEEGEDGADAAHAADDKKKHDSKHPPTFVPLEPFVVNLADKDAERYAQIGITLELDDAQFAEQIKAYMPAIRNGILLTLSHKTSQELLSIEGKLALSKEILREAVKPLGIEIPVAGTEAAEAHAADEDEDDDTSAKKKKKKKKAAAPATPNPVRNVHFSNFIVQ
jgi:flagellar FliL protein